VLFSYTCGMNLHVIKDLHEHYDFSTRHGNLARNVRAIDFLNLRRKFIDLSIRTVSFISTKHR